MQEHNKCSLALLANIIIGATVACVMAPSVGAQGLSYDMKMTMRMDPPPKGAGDMAQGRTVMAGHGQFAGGNSRMDMSQSMAPGGIMSAGTYVIVRSGARTEWIVDPAKKTYMEINVDSMAKFAADAQKMLGGMAKIEMTDVTADVQPLGAGEMIEGYATMKYHVTSGYTSKVSMMGRKTVTTTTSTGDIWVAPQLAGLYNPAAPASQGAGTSEYAQKLTAAYAKIGKGVPIKSVTTSQSTGSRTSSTTSTMELVNIKRGRIDQSVFEVPDGYTKTDLTQAMGGAVEGMGTLQKSMPKGNIAGEMTDSAKQGAREGATEAAKEQAREKARNAVGKIFRRPLE